MYNHLDRLFHTVCLYGNRGCSFLLCRNLSLFYRCYFRIAALPFNGIFPSCHAVINRICSRSAHRPQINCFLWNMNCRVCHSYNAAVCLPLTCGSYHSDSRFLCTNQSILVNGSHCVITAAPCYSFIFFRICL